MVNRALMSGCGHHRTCLHECQNTVTTLYLLLHNSSEETHGGSCTGDWMTFLVVTSCVTMRCNPYEEQLFLRQEVAE